MLLTWHFTEYNGRKLLKDLLEHFDKVEMLEHYGQYYKLRVPKGEKSIGFLFGFLEEISEENEVSEYSASQTTLEQIFNGFATEGDETQKIRTTFYSQNVATSAPVAPTAFTGDENIKEDDETPPTNYNRRKTIVTQINE